MFEGKDRLRALITKKRASEGLEELPEDLFPKKQKHELSEEEKRKAIERRKRNKEAAEKSRTKKKAEFERLQFETDQLQQDNCELVAMISILKKNNKHLTQENAKYKSTIETLQHWIAKRCELTQDEKMDLEKQCHIRFFTMDPEMPDSPDRDASPVQANGHDTLTTEVVENKTMNKSVTLTSVLPKPSSIPKADNISKSSLQAPLDPMDCKKPTHFHQNRAAKNCHVLTPWSVTELEPIKDELVRVDEVSNQQSKKQRAEPVVMTPAVTKPNSSVVEVITGHDQPSNGQQVFYLQDGTALIVHDNWNHQFATTSSIRRAEIESHLTNTRPVVNDDRAEQDKINTAIQTLLTLGYDVKMGSDTDAIPTPSISIAHPTYFASPAKFPLVQAKILETSPSSIIRDVDHAKLYISQYRL